MKRMYRSQSEMTLLVAEWQSSQESKKAFCNQHGLSQAVFSYWLKKLQGVATKPEPVSSFVPVEVRTTSKVSDGVRLTIKFADGVEVHVH